MRLMHRLAAVLATAAVLTTSCGGRTVRTTISDPTTVDISQLWIEPHDIETRDLFAGPDAGIAAPDAATQFTFVRADQSGYSPGYDVKDANGLEWSVKLGPEAQPEVVSSRILWAIGFHQVPTYYLATWTLVGGPGGNPGPARFRPESPGQKVVGEWSWYENQFVGTGPFKGLVVANLLLNNWDWKTSNNKIYDVTGSDGVTRRYVVRDLGASLGKTAFPTALKWLPVRGFGQGSRNDLEGFESQRFILGVEGTRVLFDYQGIHEKLVDTITPRDVVWASELLARLSDEQLHDAFRAGGYGQEQATRYVAKIRSKIAEGLALKTAS